MLLTYFPNELGPLVYQLSGSTLLKRIKIPISISQDSKKEGTPETLRRPKVRTAKERLPSCEIKEDLCSCDSRESLEEPPWKIQLFRWLFQDWEEP